MSATLRPWYCANTVILAALSVLLISATKAFFLSRVIAIKILSLIDVLFDQIVNELVMRVSRRSIFCKIKSL
jgi:hypothetical protein